MSAVQIMPFLFEGERLVRVIEREGEPWFVAVDVCRCLEIQRTHDAVRGLDADERGTDTIRTLGGPQQISIVSEPGLYRLIFTSRKQKAERFKRWLAHDVIPAIRRTGHYAAAPEVMRPEPDEVRDVALNLRMVTETRQTWGCKASQQMWLRQHLPTVPAMFDRPGGDLLSWVPSPPSGGS